jgi:hypothetical protein
MGWGYCLCPESHKTHNYLNTNPSSSYWFVSVQLDILLGCGNAQEKPNLKPKKTQQGPFFYSFT